MKFVAEKALLLAALQRCARVAVRVNTIAILTHVRIEARKGRVALAATDMDREIVVGLAAAVDRAGGTTANAKALLDFVSGIADGSQVEIEQPKANARLALRAGRTRAAMATLPASDFPEFKTEADPLAVELDGRALAATLGSVAHAQSNEETRFYLNGVYLHRRAARELVAVATDGHRLARTVLALERDLPDFASPILPHAAVADLQALASQADRIELAIGETLVRATAGDTVFATKLIDGTFPDYERVLPPADIESGFDTERTAFAAAARRCDILSDGKDHTVKLAPAAGTVEISSGHSAHGEIVDELDARTSTGDAIGVNPRYLLAALDALGGKTARVRYENAGAPIAVTDPDQPHKLQIIMAKRVS